MPMKRSDIDKIKLQKKDLSKAITIMESEMNKCMQLAERPQLCDQK